MSVSAAFPKLSPMPPPLSASSRQIEMSFRDNLVGAWHRKVCLGVGFAKAVHEVIEFFGNGMVVQHVYTLPPEDKLISCWRGSWSADPLLRDGGALLLLLDVELANAEKETFSYRAEITVDEKAVGLAERLILANAESSGTYARVS